MRQSQGNQKKVDIAVKSKVLMIGGGGGKFRKKDWV